MSNIPKDESPEDREARLLRGRNASRKWREANPGKRNAHDKKYQSSLSPEKINKNTEYQKQWRKDNRKRVIEKQREWLANHPEYEKKRDDNTRRRRAKLAAVAYEPFTVEDMLSRWGTDCHICHEPIDMDAPRKVGESVGWELGLHLDHVTSIYKGGSHTLDNCKPAHGICNLKKGSG